MHDESAKGSDYFKCDFCHQGWSDDRPMVEGHQGSLICSACLTVAYSELMFAKVSDDPDADEACVLCMETGRDDPHWRSPATGAIACRRCVKQSAGVLHKDREIAWEKPVAVENPGE